MNNRIITGQAAGIYNVNGFVRWIVASNLSNLISTCVTPCKQEISIRQYRLIGFWSVR